jgi:hypothetical protein
MLVCLCAALLWKMVCVSIEGGLTHEMILQLPSEFKNFVVRGEGSGG